MRRKVTTPVPPKLPIMVISHGSNRALVVRYLPYRYLAFATQRLDNVSYMVPAGRVDEVRRAFRDFHRGCEVTVLEDYTTQQYLEVEVAHVTDYVTIGRYMASQQGVVPREYAGYFGPSLGVRMAEALLLLSTVFWLLGCVAVCTICSAARRLHKGLPARGRLVLLLIVVCSLTGWTLATRFLPLPYSFMTAKGSQGIEYREISDLLLNELEEYCRQHGKYPDALTDLPAGDPGGFSYGCGNWSYWLRCTNAIIAFEITREYGAKPQFSFLGAQTESARSAVP